MMRTVVFLLCLCKGRVIWGELLTFVITPVSIKLKPLFYKRAQIHSNKSRITKPENPFYELGENKIKIK